MNLAPIIIFCYKRFDTLQQTVEALQKNYLAQQSDIFIFSDAAKGDKDKDGVHAVRDYIRTITGFKSVTIYEAAQNKGLANSIIDGVTQIFKAYESAIVLEDDLVSSPNFLDYMNEALNYYKNEQSVFSITGFSMPIKSTTKSDVYFTQRSSSWSWATWKDRWKDIDWKVEDYTQFENDKKQRKAFNKMGSDMSSMLDRQMKGEINSWAIRWCYHQFKNNFFTVHAIKSKIVNIGFTPDASNTNEKYNRFKTTLDTDLKTSFKFSNDIKLDKSIIKQYVKPFSIKARVKYKIINFFVR